MGNTCNDLLHLEINKPSSSPLESTLLVCKKAVATQNKEESHHPKGMPATAPVPASQVLGKVKDFLGFLSEANSKLQENSNEDHDIEALTGNESELIEMDLMLGVADLHTPEAVAAAESAVAGAPPIMALAASGSELEDSSDNDSEDSSDDEEDDGDGKLDQNKAKSNFKFHIRKPEGKNPKARKRSKIVELS